MRSSPRLGGGLRAHGIRVNTLVPGTIDTDFRRFMADFLLSDAASVTAARYFVDSGLSRR